MSEKGPTSGGKKNVDGKKEVKVVQPGVTLTPVKGKDIVKKATEKGLRPKITRERGPNETGF